MSAPLPALRPGPRRVPGGAGLAAAAALAFGSLVPLASSWTALLALVAAPLVAAVAVGASLPTLLVAVIVSTQLSAMRFGLAGLHFLPEHVALAVFAAALVLRAPGTLIRRPAAFEALFLAWVAWNGVVSVAFSENAAESLAIVGWMLLAWLVLWCVRGYVEEHRAAARRALDAGMRVAAGIGGAAGFLWLGARWGLWSVGVQPEYVTGSVAARGLSIEANLFGSLELLWLLLALRWRVVNGVAVSRLRLVGLGVGVVASMTRAVWLAAVLLAAVAVVARWSETTRRRAAGDRMGGGRAPARAIVALAALVALFPLSGPAVDKLSSALDFGSTTGLERVRNWEVALEDLDSSGSYLLGRGTNSYGQRHESHTVAGEPGYLGNLGLTILYDTGLVGVLLFVAASLAFVLHRHAGWARVFKAVFLAVLVVVGAAASPIWFGYVWIAFAALATVWRSEDVDDGGDVGTGAARAEPAPERSATW